MGFSDEDEILIENLHDSKGYDIKKTNKTVSWNKMKQKVDCHTASYQPETNS